MYLFEGLKNQISEYLPSDQVDRVEHAFKVAKDAHSSQKRSSGEPYITHPVAVASLLADMRLDHETLMAALLHDVIEDTEIKEEDLAEMFGSTVAALVEGVSKLDKLQFNSKEEAQAENYRKMIMAMTQDIRVILIKLADRTHNMRTIQHLRPDKRRRIARETLEIYAPLAHRLGIHDVKNELERLGFWALFPWRAKLLESEVKKARGNRREFMERVQHEIHARLEGNSISARVMGREKHLHSIYRKMLNKELRFNQVMDIYAFRVIVDSVDTCYRVLGALHNLYKPIETRFKDYIAIPKSNGYQSLHTSLKGPHGVPVEIQIRTEEMDLMADRGVAAHWLYKNNDDSGTTAQVRARKWMQSLLELQQSAGSSFEFIENVKSDLFPDEIYVFTPDGRIVELPQGATAVDFAYAVHTDVGNTCVGARVNHRTYSLSKPLETGQTVEVKTVPGSRPNIAWLNFVVTGKARAKIRQFLKGQEASEAEHLGERLLRSALGSLSYDEIPNSEFERVIAELKLETRGELLKQIGLGNLMSLAVAKRLMGELQPLKDESLNRKSLSIKGAEGLLVSFAKCCRPIPGDDIIAHVSPGKGLVIHRRECKNVRGHEDEPGRYFPVEWDNNPEAEFISEIRIEIINHQGALAKLTSAIATTGCNIDGLKTEEIDANIYFIDVALTIKNRKHLADVIRHIRKMPDVQRVTRLRK
ncbi:MULTISPECIES: bifunctional GTP diphosphokinase/guanosine-3',5'-bis pyrophosphate 3'-pyrophosphohydrolase [unclassified Idiomarina]|uniref:bifunctional GTP diphosphokinase/guanosine-3',5'-bis pyrophosphate 3'-pyrophosphohydrolase n=1 Tax=unclassified Idiomarina TaxID=2614829 RepID=UPI0008F83C2F|nr:MULTISPECIES: bifunctional GTP diphosphokinase/guanosine-3',5'-bis pyrophosphate 3'-pyrophosphohydrolase [unclassified Idiomarina]MAD53321.1 bifunctional GTP diphosphokinase/guanosine-3',5'-bis(diphosphate) 3'-diphosphatase [Idiomarinaceae bacterium]MEC7643270.1 bifunctional GTP diphosphokinase/guanosine-3',5'-bis pyrophosphate 3'-pyrophosphohydrolase [Pseudomonadota bacterium]NQZ04758.1 bifunctional GTP diphosphokinase/guanosine-3',5'-bis pyrophosphate 3'-pyrophosphohydrolase [Idiomarina sp.